MKNALLLFATVGIAFASCEEKLPGEEVPETQQMAEQPGEEPEGASIAGTTWETRVEEGRYWSEYKLVFSSTHVTYTEAHSSNYEWSFTGTYTYDPPFFVITEEPEVWPYNFFTGESGEWVYQKKHEGTIEDDTITVDIQATIDEIMAIELQKQ